MVRTPGMGFDARVHQRLGVTRLVSFVVAQFAKTDHVQHDVFVELLPVIQSDLQRAISGFRIVAVDVKDRQLRHARDVSRIDRRAPGFRRSGKADLIVDDDVNRAAGAIALQARQVQRLHHHALAGKGRIAVQQHRQHAIDNFLARASQLRRADPAWRADHTFDHRIDGFQVAGIGRERQTFTLRPLRVSRSPTAP